MQSAQQLSRLWAKAPRGSAFRPTVPTNAAGFVALALMLKKDRPTALLSLACTGNITRDAHKQ